MEVLWVDRTKPTLTKEKVVSLEDLGWRILGEADDPYFGADGHVSDPL